MTRPAPPRGGGYTRREVRRILLLTDRPPELVLPALAELGADVKTESPSPDAAARIADLGPDLIVVDAGRLPERAFALLETLRPARGAAAVVAVSTETIEAERWEAVADDVVLDSASAAELRVRLAVLRARLGDTGHEVVRLGPVGINVETYQVTAGGRPLDLTYKEFELLRFLAERPGRVFTRAGLLQEVWGYDFYGGTRTVDVHVRRLRAKLGPEHEHLIETVRGVGYRAADPS